VHNFRVADLSEQAAMAALEQRLSSKFADLPPDRIAAAVQGARARFERSPIRDFVPLLVERRARAELSTPSL
jgi:hypothetical protein